MATTERPCGCLTDQPHAKFCAVSMGHMIEPTAATTFYLIEVRDSDGNDCSVFDVIAPGATKDAALDVVWDYIRECCPDDEEDGGDGTYHPCNCSELCASDASIASANECPAHGPDGDEDLDCATAEGCDGHGGISVDRHNVEAFETYDAALAARARYHELIDLTED